MTRRAAAILAPILAVAPLPVPALELDLPPGATLAFEEASAADSHLLALGPWAEGALPARTVEGAVRRQVWQVEGSATTLQLLAPLRDQVAAQGLSVLFDCDTDACGGFDFRLGVEVLPPPAMFVDLGDFRYLAAEGEGEWASLLVSRTDGKGFVQVVRVAPTDPATDPTADPAAPAAPSPGEAGAALLATAPPGDLARRLDADGRAVLGGLAFATGSADLAPGGDAVLAELAAWLAADPARRVAVVGHTDAEGSLEANVAVSRRRAAAVVGRLVRDLGADAARLDAEGMGYLAPLATNLTEEGRRANRRVEAIVLPPD